MITMTADNQTRQVDDFLIESSVPIPRRLHGAVKYRALVDAMLPGDSVRVGSHRQAAYLRCAMALVYGKGAATIRKLTDGSYRVWRTQ